MKLTGSIISALFICLIGTDVQAQQSDWDCSGSAQEAKDKCKAAAQGAYRDNNIESHEASQQVEDNNENIDGVFSRTGNHDTGSLTQRVNSDGIERVNDALRTCQDQRQRLIHACDIAARRVNERRDMQKDEGLRSETLSHIREVKDETMDLIDARINGLESNRQFMLNNVGGGRAVSSSSGIGL